MAQKTLWQLFPFKGNENCDSEEEITIHQSNASETPAKGPIETTTSWSVQNQPVLKSIERVYLESYDEASRSAMAEMCQTDNHLSLASFAYKQVKHSTQLKLCQADHSTRLCTFKSLCTSAQDGCGVCTIWRDGISLIFPSSDLSDAEFFWCLQTWDRTMLTGKMGSELELFTTSMPVSWLPGLPTAKIPPGDTADNLSLSTLRQWLDDCVSKHSSCEPRDLQPLPTRILEVSLNEGCMEIKLHISEPKESAYYICLSHCWGSTPTKCCTTRDSIRQYTQSISWDAMPKTFQDAAIITQKLGLKYLWIDSLCIVQDDPIDWQKESSRMADIYARSHLTLAATSSVNDEGGLFFRQSREYASHSIKTTGPEGQQGSICIRRRLPHHTERLSRHPLHQVTEDYPLFHRAWTFQELLLSPRVVHFSKEELIWECKQRANCQCSPPERSVSSDFIDPEACDSHYDWQELVRKFSVRELSFGKDKLPALSGAAKASPQWKQGQKYLAGLWEPNLVFDILWEPLEQSESCRIWRAPSWSWASINGEVRFCKWKEIHQQYVRVVSSACTPSGLDPTGEVSAGAIELCGPLVRVTLSPKEGRSRGFIETLDDKHFHFWSDYDLNEVGDWHIAAGSDLYCLRLFTFRYYDAWKPGLTPIQVHFQDIYLVLYTEGTPASTFRRIGLIETFRGLAKGLSTLSEGASVQCVTII